MALLAAALVLAQSWYFHYSALLGARLAGLARCSPANLVLRRALRLFALGWKTSTPSSLEDELPVRVRRSRTSCAAVGSGAERSA